MIIQLALSMEGNFSLLWLMKELGGDREEVKE
jgi:hypothetical protein